MTSGSVSARQHGSLTWLVLPALAIFTAFGVIPLIGVLLLSFTSWNGIGEITPIGFENWVSVLTDPGLVHSLGVTFLIMALSWLVQTPMSILVGVFIAGQQRYRTVLAVLYFTPLLLSSAAIAITYKALLDPNFGLGASLGIPLLVQNWLGDPVLAIATVVFVVSWQFIPFHSLIYQGAVRQIPASLYEAARIDGADAGQIVRYVKLPLVRPAIVLTTVFTIIGTLQLFAEPLVLRPVSTAINTSYTPNLAAYTQAFVNNNYSLAAAQSVILAVAACVLSFGFLRLVGRKGDDR